VDALQRAIERRTAQRPSGAISFDVVIPTIGRPSLDALLRRLDTIDGPRPGRLVLVDDRAGPAAPLRVPFLSTLQPTIVASGGRGPAAARNAGWRHCAAPWIAFLDDDVVPSETWLTDLVHDLAAAGTHAGASHGRIVVPRPAGRKPYDAEREVGNLESAAWITADMAVRRPVLVETGGFDERFRRAYREDTDLALRMIDAGLDIAAGRRAVVHPVRSGTWRTSIRAQRGNSDDALMARLHGPDWRQRGRAPRGDLPAHVLVVALSTLAAGARLTGRRALARRMTVGAALLAAQGWVRRAARGPAEARELGRLAASSALIPFAATYWALWGRARAAWLAPAGPSDRWRARLPRAVLFDRDGTLIRDIPFNGDPDLVVPVDGAKAAVDRLRTRGVAVGVITNQSGIGRGLIDPAQVAAVNARVESLLGPFDVVHVCPHAPDDACSCRKPSPGMIIAAARELGVDPSECAVIGDIGADVDAALAAGARAVLVPNGETFVDEIVNAPEVAATIEHAVDLLLVDSRGVSPRGVSQ
jgi:HAD superfamily hydrolase (TIGR01662 family)